MEKLEEIVSEGSPDEETNKKDSPNFDLPNAACPSDCKKPQLAYENLVDSGIAISNSSFSEIYKVNNSSEKESLSKATSPASDGADLSELPIDIFSNANELRNCSTITNENCSADQITSISDSLFENIDSDAEDFIDDLYQDHKTLSPNNGVISDKSINEDIQPILTLDGVDNCKEVNNPSSIIQRKSMPAQSEQDQINPIFSDDSAEIDIPIRTYQPDSKVKSTTLDSEINEPNNTKSDATIVEYKEKSTEPKIINIEDENFYLDSHSKLVTSEVNVCQNKKTNFLNSTDTTQRQVHEAKTSKKSETELTQKEHNTPCNFSAANFGDKPPCQLASHPSQSSSDSQSFPTAETKQKSSAMAFTVDFGEAGTSDSSGSAVANKRLDISGPISQFAPKHKRNLSSSKVEDTKKVEERRLEKPPVGRPRSNTAGTIVVVARRGGYHSEGYFSSDQDDEAAKKADLKSPRSARSAGLPSINRPSSDEAKSNILKARPDSPSNSYTVPLTESANFLIEKMLTATPEMKRKSYGKSEGRPCCKEKKPSLPEINGRLNRSQEKICSPKSDSDSSKRNSNSSPTFSDPSKDDKDDASDTGTYTIDKDSPEVEAARKDIGVVFGVLAESDVELASSTAVSHSTTIDGILNEKSSLLAAEKHKQKVVPAVNRSSANWIQQWADSVAEQTKPALKSTLPKSPVSSPRAEKTNMAVQPSLQDSLNARPRRKLPTPPQYPSPRNYAKDSMFNGDEQRTQKTKSRSFRNYIESQESGGDSDLDFRTYSNTDDERITDSLRDKLRLTGLNASSPKNLPSPRTSPKRFNALAGASHNKMIDDVFCDKLSDQSDSSSSETSEQYKEPIRISSENPPLKFNRAFSLRRARLTCDGTAKQVAEKKKTQRPLSAGTGKKTQLSGTPAYQNVDSLSSEVKSPSKKINVKREPTSKKGPRSNSTLSTKEVDFQNWKRRKNYDPMKAAAEGRKKQVEKKIDKTIDQNDLPSDSSPSPHNSLLRSASFHGTNGADMRWGNKLKNHLHYTSEEDGPLSLEEEVFRRLSSPLHRSPSSPKPVYAPAVGHRYSQGGPRALRTPVEGIEGTSTPHFQVSARKVSLDESGSEGKRSPLNSHGSGKGNRLKTKMEALDNLVISTIHSLSVKVRITAESLLLKLKSHYDEEGERAALLQEVLAHLTEGDQSLPTQNRSTSRELAGVLRNLKKIEHALQVVDRVMVAELFIDEDDAEDIPNDWGESDY